MALHPLHISEGIRIFRHSSRRKIKGHKRYNGNAEEICRRIVEDCWNGTFFQTSNGHFRQFYTRDFGWCAESLINLGYEKEVEQTLGYALEIFEKSNKITTTITPSGKAVDIFTYSPDSLAFILRTLSLLKSKSLVKKHSEFLNSEILKFCKIVDENGLVRKNRHFSSMKDYSKRKSSCYDNVMVFVVNESLKKIKILGNPLRGFDFKKIIIENFWNGQYFLDDLSGKSHVAGDANIFPFWAGVFDSKDMIKSALMKIQEENLDKPLPLKYTGDKVRTKMSMQELFVKNYEQNTIWAHMGPIFIDIFSRIDKNRARQYLKEYKNIIERHENFMEAFDNSLSPFKTLFYHADESMLWAANYLTLSKKLF